MSWRDGAASPPPIPRCILNGEIAGVGGVFNSIRFVQNCKHSHNRPFANQLTLVLSDPGTLSMGRLGKVRDHGVMTHYKTFLLE